jgi:hypothetical protein
MENAVSGEGPNVSPIAVTVRIGFVSVVMEGSGDDTSHVGDLNDWELALAITAAEQAERILTRERTRRNDLRQTTRPTPTANSRLFGGLYGLGFGT